MPTVNLDTGDAAELAELLQFLHDWIATDAEHLEDELRQLMATTPGQVRAALARTFPRSAPPAA